MIKIRIMGKLKFFSLLIAAGMFAACSDNLENGGTGNEGGAKGTGYVKISLNLPTTSGGSSRADSDNDEFDNGLAEEYNVKDVILALFYGTSESDATCKWATTLITSFGTANSDPSNITTTSTSVVSEVPQPDEGQSIYALAIINGKDYFGISNKELTFDANATTKVTFIGKKLSDLFTNASPVAIDKIAKTTEGGYFMMTNAPISDKASVQSKVSDWNPQITTLVKLNYYEDESTAEKTTPDPIYVERVVAKVNVKINSTDNTLTINDTNETPVGKVAFSGWALQTTNKKTYLVRNAGTVTSTDWNDWKTYYNTAAKSTENRFVGTLPGPYRTYWGIDPNYNLLEETNLSENFNILESDPGDDDWLAPANNNTASDQEKVAYCAENTTIAKAMQQDQLTGVLLKATYTDAGGTTANIFTYGNVSTIYPEATMLNEFEKKLGTPAVKLKVKTKAAGAIITTVDELKNVIVKSDDSSLTDKQYEDLLATYSPIKFYANGETFYYASLIKHFGDVYTPIKSDQNIVNLDDYEEADHLGRWGVVRNNWYELIINSVSGLGEPEIPDNPQLPADTENRYINCSINVLSWAKRSQGVDL